MGKKNCSGIRRISLSCSDNKVFNFTFHKNRTVLVKRVSDKIY